MDLIRKFFSFVNRTGESLTAANGPSSIPGYYLGHTYTAQPTPEELRRAAYILTIKSKKDLEKNTIPMLSLCFEDSVVVLRDGKNHNCCHYDIRKIVVSCVDAKNQRLLAIFYHNDSPFIASPTMSRGLECHLFLCRTKDIAKFAANKIGELLAKQYDKPSPRKPVNFNTTDIRLSKAIGQNDDFDYENISKFFRQKVFNDRHDIPDRSMLSTPCASLSTCATTTGCDSGRASTSASIDIKCFDLTSRYSSTNTDPGYIIENNCDMHTNRNIYQNRDSVHYDLEEEYKDNINHPKSSYAGRTCDEIVYNDSVDVVLENTRHSSNSQTNKKLQNVDIEYKPFKISNDCTGIRSHAIDIHTNGTAYRVDKNANAEINEICDVKMKQDELERLLELDETDI